MNRVLVLLCIMFAVVAALLAANYYSRPADIEKTETAFERVLRTKTLRCGYAPVGLALVKDPNTGELSGPVHDVMSAIGRSLEIKIDWAEEITFGTAMAGLQAGRYDAVCSNLYARPSWAPYAEASAPYYHVPVNAYARIGDNRFTSRAAINNPEIKIAYQDGTVPLFIKKNDFPNAGDYAVIDMDYSDILMAVATGKADITFVEPAVAEAFIAANPGKIEKVSSVSPLYVFPIVIAVKKGEHSLNTMISDVIGFLQQKGEIASIIKRHSMFPDIFWPMAPTYIKPVSELR